MGHSRIDVAPVDETARLRDEQEAQRSHAAEYVGVDPLARARLGRREGVELETAGDAVGEDAQLLPGAVGPVVAGGRHVEGELDLSSPKVFS